MQSPENLSGEGQWVQPAQRLLEEGRWCRGGLSVDALTPSSPSAQQDC